MRDTRERLASCFWAVFPDLIGHEISTATSTTIQGWDSVGGVTLLAVVEEEFGISIHVEVNDLTRLSSFNGLLEYLQGDPAANDSQPQSE